MIEERQRVIEEARTWLGTPYHTNAALRGIGVDCIRFIQRCYVESGVVPDFEIPLYPAQWALHQKSELLLEGLLRYSHEVGAPGPADVAVFQIGHCWGHSSIVVEWPVLIHANPPGNCRLDDARRNSTLLRLTPRFFSVWD